MKPSSPPAKKKHPRREKIIRVHPRLPELTDPEAFDHVNDSVFNDQTEDGRTRLEVRLENETVWLTQAQMAELFQTTQQNISLHLQNIYEEGELQLPATHKESLSVRREGNRDVQRRLDHYNLDAIIAGTQPTIPQRTAANRGNIS
ncbi:MAG: hypothetical protein KGR98_01255 [Verrucomicrobia bacterium]|nr:hypothetical protein [Verrucomicrobiota bacterium]MDE3098954.1 hypothetical protein [Verrucomicrobiota bacterium]